MAKETEIEKLSLSKLAMRFNLDRATARGRLLEAGIEPVEEKAKEKIFALTDDLRIALTAQTKPMDAAKLKKTEAEAELKEIEVAKRRGEMASVAEFTEVTSSLFGAMHKKIAVLLPKRIAGKLAKAATAKEISDILSRELNKEFSDLRGDYRQYLN